MKRILSLILVILLISTMLVGCTKKAEKDSKSDKDDDSAYDDLIVTEVDLDYTYDIADDYAEKSECDYDKRVVKYGFEEDKYDEFLVELHDIVKEELREKIQSETYYTHVNLNTPEVIIGLSEEAYYSYSDDELELEAMEIGEIAVKYQLNTENPVLSVEITYRDAENGDEFFTYTYDYE